MKNLHVYHIGQKPPAEHRKIWKKLIAITGKPHQRRQTMENFLTVRFRILESSAEITQNKRRE